MPPPSEPYVPSLAAGLSAQEAADADEDYLYFLGHVHLDGDAYTVVIPSKDGASSPPQIIRYEQPVPDHNAGIPVAVSECGGRRTPPPSEENSRATSEAPHDVKRKAPDASPGGEVVCSCAAPMEEDTPSPVVEVEQSWYDSPDIDEDYRFFLRHVSVVKDKLMFKTENHSITIGDVPSVDNSDAEEDDGTEEEEEEEEEEEGEEDDDEVDGPASGQSGEDSIGTDEKDVQEEVIPTSDTEHGVDSDLLILKDEEVCKEEEDGVGRGSDLQIVNDPVNYEVSEEVERPLNALLRGATDLDPLDRKEASSSKALLVMPLNASESQGVIWPPHINERPISAFKEKLIEFLKQPFTQEEYESYFALATERTPMVRERRTRNTVAYYISRHERSKSYFDRFPDLAEQFSLQCNNHPNGLALLRGLFFWLQNIGLDDQFRPWSDAFKRYLVVPSTE